MFCYQYYKSDECRPCTSDVFSQLIVSDNVTNLIRNVRRMRAEDKMKGADLQKRMLPLLCFCASSFDPSPAASDSRGGGRKKGDMGRWRLQHYVHLNGLYMVDYDHLEAPSELPDGADPEKESPGKLWVRRWVEDYYSLIGLDNLAWKEKLHNFCESMGILLIHDTSSRQGLRIVAIASVERGNLADNQAWLSEKLGMKLDESCKDASRGSFCPGFEDIIYINKERLFTYENPKYDETFGPLYRGGSSAPRGTAHPSSNAHGNHAPQPAMPSADGAGSAVNGLDERLKEGYHGKSWKDICDAWFASVLKRVPGPGDRHQSLYRMACDLRYVSDFNPKLLARILAEHEVGAAIRDERGADELERIASDACALQRWQTIPKRVLTTLERAGVELDAGCSDKPSAPSVALDYGAYWDRLRPLLAESPGLREAVADLPDHHKLGGVLAAGAMLGTYLTRVWWEHFDGKLYRLSFLTYIVGAAASGKSFLTKLDSLLMAPMKNADAVGRNAEREYKEQQKSRKANEKLPAQPHPVIRYCPSTTSNAVLYRRLQDAVDERILDPETDQPLHLHLITVESELATALRAQVGSWAGKADLELKSFHNEYAGVDFANAESTNGIMQINWNQVVSGTQESLSRKIRPATILDGLVTRLSLYIMPGNDFEMIERTRKVRNHERECYLRSLGYKLEEVSGELHLEKLVQFCWEYEGELTRRARIEQDYCLDYFRKRIPVMMMRYTIVRIILRQLEAAQKCEDLTVEDSDLEFARLIGDWCLEAQMYMFGEMVMQAQEKERQTFSPRVMYRKTREGYNALPMVFDVDSLVSSGLCKNINAARVMIHRWVADKLVTKDSDKTYKRNFVKL